MNWDAIGAVGEIVGALAVVVTLAYLALQVRASTRESEANAFAVTSDHRTMIRGQFMEHADVWARGNAEGELSPAERIVFDELVMSRADHHFSAFARSRTRGSGRESIHVSQLARFLHGHPVACARWRTEQRSLVESRIRLGVAKDRAGGDFGGMVEEAIAALDSMEESGAT